MGSFRHSPVWKRLDREFSSEYDRQKIICSFKEYCFFMFPSEVKIYPFHIIIMEKIEAIIEGKIPPRLAIFMPPRHGKTLIGADMFMSYMFGRFPHRHGVYGTYNTEFAEKRKRQLAAYLRHNKFQWLFPKAKIKGSLSEADKHALKNQSGISDTSTYISNALSSQGGLLFVGQGSSLTGLPIHYGACDDLYKDKEHAESIKYNEKVKQWFDLVWNSRLEVGTFSLLFYTRWSEDDIAGSVLEYDEKMKGNEFHIPYLVLRFPDYKDDLNDNPWDLRKKDEPLIPEMQFRYVAAQKDMNWYMAMYRQLPVGMSDRYVYKGIECPTYDEIPTNLSYIVISVDTTYHKQTSNVDTVGLTVMGIQGMNIYFLPDFVNEKLDFNELEIITLQYAQRYPTYSALLIEDAANGRALENRLSLVAPKVWLVPTAGKTKRERAQVVIGYFKSRNVWLPSRRICPRIEELYAEMQQFTGLGNREEKDDLLDTIHQSLKHYDDMKIFTLNYQVATVPIGRRSIVRRHSSLRGTQSQYSRLRGRSSVRNIKLQ